MDKLIKLQLFATQTYGASGNQLTAENAEFYQRTLLKRYLEEITFSKYAKKQSIPKNSGATTSFRRLELLSTNPSSYVLTEGVNPSEVNVTVNKVSATIGQNGAWVKISQYLDDYGLDSLITEVATMLGEHGARVNDNIVRNILVAGTNVFYAAGRVSRVTVAAGDKITYANILKMYETLKTNKAPKMSLPNGAKGYLAFIHPAIATGVKNLAEWREANRYDDPMMIKEGIIGQLGGIYFMETSEATIFTGAGAAGIDVYATVIVADESYATPDVGGSMKPEVIVKKPQGNDTDTSNPLNQYGTVGWKSAFASLILNQAGVLRYESAAA